MEGLRHGRLRHSEEGGGDPRVASRVLQELAGMVGNGKTVLAIGRGTRLRRKGKAQGRGREKRSDCRTGLWPRVF